MEGGIMPERIPTLGGGSTSSFDPVRISDVVYIYEEADFPAPIGGIIQLENKAYKIVGAVSSANSLRFPASGGCQMFMDVTVSSSYTYTGIGAMFDDPTMEALVFLEKLFLSTPNGAVFDLTGTNGVMIMDTCIFTGGPSVGSLTGVLVNMKKNKMGGFGQGFIFTDNSGVLFNGNKMDGGLNLAGANLIDIQGTHKDIQVSDNFMSTAGANETILKIDAASTTIGAIAVGNGFDILSGGSVFGPGKDKTDIQWEFSSNTSIEDSDASGSASFPGIDELTIATPGVAVRVDDVNSGATNLWVLNDKERFTHDATTGRFTYIGLDPDTINVSYGATISKGAGGGAANKLFMEIFKNGATIVRSQSSSENTTPSSLSRSIRILFQTNDYIELFTGNNDGTTNVVLEDVVLTIG